MLAKEFLCTYTNITGDSSAGHSFSHSPSDAPGPCGRGAGRANVQTIFTTPDGNIFHVATGFLSPADLKAELTVAKRLFSSLESASVDPKQQLVTAQTERMREIGFTDREIAYDDMFEEMRTGFNPADLGMRSPSRGMFGDIDRARTLRDTKYVLRNPLIHRDDFESDPTKLVGRLPSFFGSNAAMNMLAR